MAKCVLCVCVLPASMKEQKDWKLNFRKFYGIEKKNLLWFFSFLAATEVKWIFCLLQCSYVFNARLYAVKIVKGKKLNFYFWNIFACNAHTHHIWLRKDQVIIFQGCLNFEPMWTEFWIDAAQRHRTEHRKMCTAKRRGASKIVARALRACWKLKFIDRSTGTRQFLNTFGERRNSEEILRK